MDKLGKLIIQIPCYNEAGTIRATLKALPRQIDGFSQVEWLLIDDGSTDNTVAQAQECGIDHIVRFNKNYGLARAYAAGLDACLKLGADVIVNTDADNQYDARDIPKLVAPILERKADIVVGARPIDTIEHFSALKKLLQKSGSRVVRMVSNADVTDAPSGFRAISKDAALHLNVFSKYTYTLETLIQAGQKNMLIVSVPVRTNKNLRASRLAKGPLSYVYRSIDTIVRIFVVYKPFCFFMLIGVVLFSLGVLLGLRYLVYVWLGDTRGHIQSLILASILSGMGFQTILMAFLADMVAVSRKLSEDLQYRLKKMELESCIKNKEKQ